MQPLTSLKERSKQLTVPYASDELLINHELRLIDLRFIAPHISLQLRWLTTCSLLILAEGLCLGKY